VDSGPYVLFIGRLHPTKGLDMLIEAFGRAKLPGSWRLLIVGPPVDQRYAAQLRQAIAVNPRAGRIELMEPVWDTAAKYALMRNARVTVVPSHSEVISLVNLESSACSTPTITTRETGISDWMEGGGLLVEAAVQPITAALSASACWSDEERIQRGAASRRLIEERYSAAANMPRWMELYRSLK
jgi:glycosyltransferase involved in cell wall biosynthesis